MVFLTILYKLIVVETLRSAVVLSYTTAFVYVPAFKVILVKFAKTVPSIMLEESKQQYPLILNVKVSGTVIVASKLPPSVCTSSP